MAANRSSVVRVRDGVGVTMFSSDAPLADGAGDDSAVLESNTSPEKEKLHTHSYGRVNTHTHTHTLHSVQHACTHSGIHYPVALT